MTSTPDTLRWWGDQIRKCTREFYFSHVLVADLNYGADEIEELQAENAKLREDMEDLEGYDQMLRDRLRQETELQVKAEAENAKLRELVRDMCDFFCVVPDEPLVFKEELDFSVEVWRRMRELGIEVGE